MKIKIKKWAYAASAAALFAPLLALAEEAGSGFQIPGNTGLQQGSITDILNNGMNWLLMIVGVIGVVAFAISGILYLTAAGDEERIKTAKKAMIMSIVGVVVALLGVVILKAVQSFLSGNQSKF